MSAVRDTSIAAYYARISGVVEMSQVDQVVAYVVAHPCCTRRQIAAHFHSLDPDSALAQEARVAARVNAALKRRVNGQPLLVESEATVVDAETGHEAYPLYASNYGLQRPLLEEAA